MEEINLKKIIAEAREIAESLDEFADKLEKIEKKHTESDKYTSNNGFPYFMEELTEDDLFAIAGGCDPLTCIVLPVLLAVTALGGAAIFEFTEIKW